MRRVLAIALGLAALAGAALAATGAGNGTTGGYRIDAIFDNASFLIPGQDVKIAGAKVGTVSDVRLTPDHKARIQMGIDERFAPFRSDADCTIQPQSLIGEKFIQCTPGTTRGQEIRATAEEAPTVPLANTHSPVDLDLVFGTFRRPTNERLALIINELGGGLAGRGADLNELIRRANPALQETNRVLRIVDADRRRIRSLIRASGRVVGELAEREDAVQRVVEEGADVATAAAERRQQIEDAVEELPELLTEAEPALRDLRRLAEAGTPVLRDLRASAPGIRRLAGNVAPLTAAARPALTRLGTASTVGRRALRSAAPVVAQLRAFAKAAKPTGVLVNELVQNLRARGVVEGLLTFAYYGALATSRFDAYSHTLPAHLLGTPCASYATTPVAECASHFVKQAPGAKRRAVRKPEARREEPAATPQPERPAGQSAPAPAPGRPKVPLIDDLLDDLPDLPGRLDDDAKEALDALLDNLGGGLGGPGGEEEPDVGSMLEFLLG